ncbi:MAG: hypothetical protein ACXVC2_03525 [Bacteroidia bacterium]
MAKAREIINVGLIKAAESLSFFMKEKMELDEMEFDYTKVVRTQNFVNKSGNDIHVLVTEVIGELKGFCCLIFSAEEAEKLRNTALPAEVLSNAAMMEELGDAILLEVDNIISASVITMFSNILKLKIHGGVPSLKKMNIKELYDFIESKIENDMNIVSFNTHFRSPSHNFSPQFLWLFDHTFSESVMRYAQTTL